MSGQCLAYPYADSREVSLPFVLARAALANCVPVGVLVDRLTGSRRMPSCGPTGARLLFVAPHDLELFASWTGLSHVQISRGVFGNAVHCPGEESLVAVLLRVCPDCWAEGFHSPLFQLTAIERCPHHGTTLVGLHDLENWRGTSRGISVDDACNAAVQLSGAPIWDQRRALPQSSPRKPVAQVSGWLRERGDILSLCPKSSAVLVNRRARPLAKDQQGTFITISGEAILGRPCEFSECFGAPGPATHLVWRLGKRQPEPDQLRLYAAVRARAERELFGSTYSEAVPVVRQRLAERQFGISQERYKLSDDILAYLRWRMFWEGQRALLSVVDFETRARPGLAYLDPIDTGDWPDALRSAAIVMAFASTLLEAQVAVRLAHEQGLDLERGIEIGSRSADGWWVQPFDGTAHFMRVGQIRSRAAERILSSLGARASEGGEWCPESRS